ncbi:MAG: HEWD family protein [Haloarculaceae archaeon]
MVTVEPPDERECERCGRHETWDDDRMTWTVVDEDGQRAVGNVHCVHEWDVNGTYSPLVED